MPVKLAFLAALAAAVPATSALAAETPAKPAKEPLICRGAEKALGSHIRRSARCRTAAEWRA